MRVLDWVVCVGEDVGLCCGSRLGWWATVAQHAVTDDRLGWERLEGGEGVGGRHEDRKAVYVYKRQCTGTCMYNSSEVSSPYAIMLCVNRGTHMYM